MFDVFLIASKSQPRFKAPRGRPDPKNRPTKIRPDCLQVPRFEIDLVGLMGPRGENPEAQVPSKVAGCPSINFNFWVGLMGGLYVAGFWKVFYIEN